MTEGEERRLSTLVLYYLPGDLDELEFPNAYLINKDPRSVTEDDVRNSFPLPGLYHFRFQVHSEIAGNPLWLDASPPETGGGSRKVPLVGHNKVIAKVLRLSWQSSSKPNGAQHGTNENPRRNEHKHPQYDLDEPSRLMETVHHSSNNSTSSNIIYTSPPPPPPCSSGVSKRVLLDSSPSSSSRLVPNLASGGSVIASPTIVKTSKDLDDILL